MFRHAWPVKFGHSPRPKEKRTVDKMEISPKPGFQVIASTSRSQAATMVIEPGSSSGGPGNRHSSSDQWLFVLSGKGTALVSGCEVNLGPGDLVLIEAGETHEIRNTGGKSLETLNVYAPKAY